MNGYGERVLHVDLSTGASEVRPLDAATARKVVEAAEEAGLVPDVAEVAT